MTQEILLHITCDHCEKEFPKVKSAKESEEGIKEFEITCPFCDTLLQVQLPDGIALAEGDSMLRGLKKL